MSQVSGAAFAFVAWLLLRLGFGVVAGVESRPCVTVCHAGDELKRVGPLLQSAKSCVTVWPIMAGMKGANGRVGLLPRKLSDAAVEAIRYYHPGLKNTEVARLFGVHESLVRRIRQGKKHVRRVRDSAERVTYQAPPPELVEREDLDVWFVRRGKALLRGYAKAVETWEREGRFEEPRPEEWQVDDEFGGDAPSSAGQRAKRIAERAQRYLAEPSAKAPKRPAENQGGANVGKGKPDVPDLLFDSKK